MLKITKTCPFCGASKTIEVPKKGYQEWMAGKRIQDALPTLSPGDRERLLSGICEQCFNYYFG